MVVVVVVLMVVIEEEVLKLRLEMGVTTMSMALYKVGEDMVWYCSLKYECFLEIECFEGPNSHVQEKGHVYSLQKLLNSIIYYKIFSCPPCDFSGSFSH